MSYQWPVEVAPLFDERYPQMTALGLPRDDVDLVRGRIEQMWGDRRGSWVHEWSQLAEKYLGDGRTDLAALAYGWAKFPALADEAKRTAYRHQIEACVASASTGPASFRRRVVEADHLGERVPVTVHEYAAPHGPVDQAPVLIASGGVDSWKEDFHGLWVASATFTGMSVLAFDIAGTGESTVPMTPDGGAAIVSSLVEEAHRIGNGRVAHLGISMGGYYAARTGLTDEVDAAVVLGGPVRSAFTALPTNAAGMHGIIGNAMGFDGQPSVEEQTARWASFSLADLLQGQQRTPMLVVDGADDPLIPQEDTLLFTGRPGVEVHLLPDSGHCATSKADEVVPLVVGWLARTLGLGTPV